MQARFDGEYIVFIHDSVLMYLLPSQVENIISSYHHKEPVKTIVKSFFVQGVKELHVDYSPRRKSRVFFHDGDSETIVNVEEFFTVLTQAYRKSEEYRYGLSGEELYHAIEELNNITDSVNRSSHIAGKMQEEDHVKTILRYLADIL